MLLHQCRVLLGMISIPAACLPFCHLYTAWEPIRWFSKGGIPFHRYTTLDAFTPSTFTFFWSGVSVVTRFHAHMCHFSAPLDSFNFHFFQSGLLPLADLLLHIASPYRGFGWKSLNRRFESSQMKPNRENYVSSFSNKRIFTPVSLVVFIKPSQP